jgi:hypothetical protein
VSWSAEEFAVYLDGAVKVSLPPTGHNDAGTTTKTILPRDLGAVTIQNWIGRSQFSADPYFAGLIDDFRIYDHALTASQAAQLYASFK